MVPLIEPPKPGTPEFAMYAKGIIEKYLNAAKNEIGIPAWDAHVSFIYGCTYDSLNGQGVNLGLDGDATLLPALLGITIRELAGRLVHHPKYVDCRGKEYKVAARLTHEIIEYAKHSAPRP
jgi:hypothetical protein